MPFFFGFFFIIVLALACGICMLINGGDPSAYVGFFYLLKSFWVLLKLTFNNNIQSTSADFGLDVSAIPQNDYILFDILYTLFFFMVMIMINLLIAIMSNTFAKFKKDSQSLLMMEKYNIMTYFEGRCILDHVYTPLELLFPPTSYLSNATMLLQALCCPRRSIVRNTPSTSPM